MSLDEEKEKEKAATKPTYIRHRPMLGVIGKFATQHSDDGPLYRLSMFHKHIPNHYCYM